MKYFIKKSQYNNAIDKFITHQLEPHKGKRTKKYPNSLFWIKDGKVIAEIEKSEYFWISHQIWMNIMNMFSLESSDKIRQVIKNWLEEHYKLGGLTPLEESEYKQLSWENITNWGI